MASATKSPFDQIAEGIAGLFAGRAIATDFNASGTAPPGRVIRCAVKPANASRALGWTTNKPSVGGFAVSAAGATGDHNHYRSTAMKGTADRALSIITSEVVEGLVAEGWPVGAGDLGENLLVTGFPYEAFRVGQRYLLGSVVVQITEPITPCAYLCTLPWLAERWRCNDFVRTLSGRRGWYARVLGAGYVNVGDGVLALA